MTFSQAVLHLRESLQLSQMAFAKELGVSYTTVNRWENGAQQPSQLAIKTIQAFCTERGLPFDFLEEQKPMRQQGEEQ